MAGGTIAPPDFNLVGQTQYIMPHQIFKQNCQFILNMFTFIRDILRILQLLNYTEIFLYQQSTFNPQFCDVLCTVRVHCTCTSTTYVQCTL